MTPSEIKARLDAWIQKGEIAIGPEKNDMISARIEALSRALLATIELEESRWLGK